MGSEKCPKCGCEYYKKLDGFEYCPECKEPKKEGEKVTLREIATWLWDPTERKRKAKRKSKDK